METKIKTEDYMPKVTVKRFKKIWKQFKNFPDDMELPMEYLLGALFPDAPVKFKELTSQCFIDGYNRGYEDRIEEEQNDN